MNIVISDKPLGAAQSKLNQILSNLTSNLTSTKVLLMLSGGSALYILEEIDDSNLSQNITFSVLDERYSNNPDENNFSQIEKTEFFSKANLKGCNYINTKVINNESMEDLATRFNNALNNWIDNNKDGKIVAIIGIGEDGHTSGVMPYPDDELKFNKLFNDGVTNHLVIAYDAESRNKYPLRVTTTMNFMRKIDYGVIYSSGQNKKAAIEKMLSNDGNLSSTPAKILTEIKGEVVLFTDQNVTI